MPPGGTFEKLPVMHGKLRCWIGLGGVVGAVACGPATRGAVAFDGRARTRVVEASQVEEVAELPQGYRSLGHVTANCTLITGARELRGAWLSDVDCSESRLRAAVRERTAAVGGELLVGLACSSQPLGKRREVESTAIRCDGVVARPAGEARALAPRPAATQTLEAPLAREAWRIRVDYTSAPDEAPRAPRRGDAVGELAELPPNYRRLGDLVTRCDAGCSERGAYEGLLVAAGRMGASDIAEVGCVRQGEGWLCTAVAGGYRVDPQQDPAAR